MSADPTAGDLLVGANAIARHLGVTTRRAYRLTYDRTIPTFKLGGSVAARRSSLNEWLNRLESGESRRAAA